MDTVGYLRRKLLTNLAYSPSIRALGSPEAMRMHINEHLTTFTIRPMTEEEFAFLCDAFGSGGGMAA